MDNNNKLELPGLYIRTFGCQMNEYDSQCISNFLSDQFRSVNSPEDAELILVNTCSVRQKAESKLYSILGTFKTIKANRPNLIIGVCGCVAQQEGAALLRRGFNIDFVVGTDNLFRIPELIREVKGGEGPQLALARTESWDEESLNGTNLGSGMQGVRALVAIQRGCNQSCSYCVVPNTRGKQISRSPEQVFKEVLNKVKGGAREVLLLGQTVNSYGSDLGGDYTFVDLLNDVANIDGLKRLRFTSPHPADVSPDLARLYKELHPVLCPHIHLPLQSGSNNVLSRMNRRYSIEDYLRVVQQLKASCPGIGITTDLIVGFPGESEEDFEQTLTLLSQIRFNSAYSYKYSRRPGTTAAQCSNDLLCNDEELTNRLLKLQQLQDEISAENNASYVGSIVEVLVEGYNFKLSSIARGRTPQNILVEITDCQVPVGSLVDVEISHSSPHGLRGLMKSQEYGR